MEFKATAFINDFKVNMVKTSKPLCDIYLHIFNYRILDKI